MPDPNAHLRDLAPLDVLSALGMDISAYRKRSGKPEWHGRCPIHQSKAHTTCFSIHQDGRFQCFSCSAKGRGAIDLVKAVRDVGFQEAISWLKGNFSSERGNIDDERGKNVPGANSDATEGVLKPYSGSYAKFRAPCHDLPMR